MEVALHYKNCRFGKAGLFLAAYNSICQYIITKCQESVRKAALSDVFLLFEVSFGYMRSELQLLAEEAREDLGDSLTNISGKNKREPGSVIK